MKLVREHINFEKPESEEDFKDKIDVGRKDIRYKKYINEIAKEYGFKEVPLNKLKGYVDFKGDPDEFKDIAFWILPNPKYDILMILYQENNSGDFKIFYRINYIGTNDVDVKYFFNKANWDLIFGKILKENTIHFERPESAEDFRDNLFEKPMYITVKDGNSFVIYFKNLYLTGFWCDYNINKKTFSWDGIGPSSRDLLIQSLKKYNIPYKIQTQKIIFPAKYVDWGEFEGYYDKLEESFNRLKIYKAGDVYEAFQNYYFYTFRWSTINSKLYNFKKIGKVGDNFKPTGRLIHNPHIQMILQLQEKISLKESFKRPGDEEDFEHELFDRQDLIYMKQLDKIAKEFGFEKIPVEKLKDLTTLEEDDDEYTDIGLWVLPVTGPPPHPVDAIPEAFVNLFKVNFSGEFKIFWRTNDDEAQDEVEVFLEPLKWDKAFGQYIEMQKSVREEAEMVLRKLKSVADKLKCKEVDVNETNYDILQVISIWRHSYKEEVVLFQPTDHHNLGKILVFFSGSLYHWRDWDSEDKWKIKLGL